MRCVLVLVLSTACGVSSADGAGTYLQITSDFGAVNAISGLAADRGGGGDTNLWAVADSALTPSRIYGLTATSSEARITSELFLRRDGASVSYDLEGIDVDPSGGWWLAAEGDESPTSVPNLLVHVDASGEVSDEVELPDAVVAGQQKYGFEGVACDDEGAAIYVAFQRGWSDDPEGLVRIGRYLPATAEWAFYHYPLSPSRGKVGLSELTWVGEGELVLLERDDEFGDESDVKQLTVVSLADVEPAPAGATPPVLEPRLLRDLLSADAWPFEKAEGAAFLGQDALVVDDNDAESDIPTFALRIDDLGRELD